MAGSIKRGAVWHHKGAQYVAVERIRAVIAVRNVAAPALQNQSQQFAF